MKGFVMIEVGISQAQTQFTKLLNQLVLVVDKKAHRKKAVILPYENYIELLSKVSQNNQDLQEGSFAKFVGILENNFQTDDIKYNKIIN